MGMDWSVREGFAWPEVRMFASEYCDSFYKRFLLFGVIFILSTKYIMYCRIKNTVRNMAECYKLTPRKLVKERRKEAYHSWEHLELEITIARYR